MRQPVARSAFRTSIDATMASTRAAAAGSISDAFAACRHRYHDAQVIGNRLPWELRFAFPMANPSRSDRNPPMPATDDRLYKTGTVLTRTLRVRYPAGRG